MQSMIFSFLLATLPIAPFSAPDEIIIPEGLPSDTIPPQIFKKVTWLDTAQMESPTFLKSNYVGLTRRRGNIVSLFVLDRTIRKNTVQDSSNIPRHSIRLYQYDCANDRYKYNSGLIWITDAVGDGPEVKGGFIYPLDFNETKWDVTPGQVRITIEGYPYWAMNPKSDPRYEEKPKEWRQITLGSYGASHIDYVCTNF